MTAETFTGFPRSQLDDCWYLFEFLDLLGYIKFNLDFDQDHGSFPRGTRQTPARSLRAPSPDPLQSMSQEDEGRRILAGHLDAARCSSAFAAAARAGSSGPAVALSTPFRLRCVLGLQPPRSRSALCAHGPQILTRRLSRRTAAGSAGRRPVFRVAAVPGRQPPPRPFARVSSPSPPDCMRQIRYFVFVAARRGRGRYLDHDRNRARDRGRSISSSCGATRSRRRRTWTTTASSCSPTTAPGGLAVSVP